MRLRREDTLVKVSGLPSEDIGGCRGERAGQAVTLLLPEGRIGLLDAGDGVVHVAGGCAPRAGRVAGLDGLGNGFVLGVHLARKIAPPRLVGARHPRHAAQKLPLGNYPNIRAWMARVEALPCWQKTDPIPHIPQELLAKLA